ncbi:riboflavin biosynthesis protein RibF [Atopobacter phocae]|uniref:riboflavin biosynthesis protein RibF n=1 Tax=Atopobacter phocae TaxID=136492 RepID=UPI00046ED160|nr:riboflavin biosynthesis protein RibF [Atopobacter phocae]
MKVIELTYPLNAGDVVNQPIVLALGFFDGLHKGHQRVIETAKTIAKARNLPLALMSFNRHPAVIFKEMKEEQMKYLSPPALKEVLLERFGVDYFYRVDFSEDFAQLRPQAFVNQYLVGLHAEVVVAGFDYTYGPHAIANMDTLPTYAANRFDIVSIPEERLLDGKVSSTRIRKFLGEHAVGQVNDMLGYYYTISGQVVHGKKRGSTLIGYPTANLSVDAPYHLPSVGVYAVMVRVNDEWLPGFASIGYNQTFESRIDTPLTIEAHIFDYQADLYGQTIQIAWISYLRPMEKFASIDALIAQLHLDKVEALKQLATVQPEQLIDL